MAIKLIKSSFMHEEQTKQKLCDFITNAQQLSIWTYCKKFESLFAQWQGSKYCVFYNSGSSANLALIQAMLNLGQLKKWDKVWFSALTRATNVMPLIQLGLVPVPVDIELDTLNVSVQTLQKTDGIKCLFLTNLLGRCDNIDEISDYCHNNNIILLEDNCESMGSIYKWKKLWNYGLAGTFSTYVGHHMSTIEWGMVCTDDRDLYNMLIMTRAHGRDRNMNAEDQEIIRKQYGVDGSFYSKYTFYTLGYNLRPNEITWFIWCEQVQYLDEIVQVREQNAKHFVQAINTNQDFHELKIDHLELFSNFAIPVVCKSSEVFQSYKQKFEDAGVEIRPIVGWDLTQQPFRTQLYGQSSEKTNARYAHEQGFYFWNSPEYTQDEIGILLGLLQAQDTSFISTPDIIARREAVTKEQN